MPWVALVAIRAKTLQGCGHQMLYHAQNFYKPRIELGLARAEAKCATCTARVSNTFALTRNATSLPVD